MLDFAIQTARDAGRILAERFGRASLKVTQKGEIAFHCLPREGGMPGTKRERAGIRGTCVAGNEMRMTLKCFVESVSVDACTDERCGDVPDFVHDSVLFFHGSLAGTPRGPGLGNAQ